MYNDDQLLAAASPFGAASRQATGALDERLLEDILHLEGALRLTTQATAGIGAPRAGEIEALGWRVPKPTAARLLTLATAIRSATQAGDITRIRHAQLSAIDALVTLRKALWDKESED